MFLLCELSFLSVFNVSMLSTSVFVMFLSVPSSCSGSVTASAGLFRISVLVNFFSFCTVLCKLKCMPVLHIVTCPLVVVLQVQMVFVLVVRLLFHLVSFCLLCIIPLCIVVCVSFQIGIGGLLEWHYQISCNLVSS